MSIVRRTFGVAFILIGLLGACKETNVDSFIFLIGTWKVEDKNQYEVWKLSETKELVGKGYRLDNGQKILLETLAIRVIEDQITYEATVPDQNDGRTVPFALIKTDDNWVVFENKLHDFPKKIMYQELSSDTIIVRVLGDNEEGFSYNLIKQIE